MKPGITFHRWGNTKFILESNAWKIYSSMLFDSDDIVDFNICLGCLLWLHNKNKMWIQNKIKLST